MYLLKSMLTHSVKPYLVNCLSICLLKDILVMLLIWLAVSLLNLLNLKLNVTMSTTNTLPPVTDSSQSMKTTWTCTLLLPTHAIKPLSILLLFLLMPKNNSPPLSLNLKVSMLESLLVKLKEIWNILLGLDSMLNMIPESMPVKMPSTSSLPWAEVLFSSNLKEESPKLPNHLKKWPILMINSPLTLHLLSLLLTLLLLLKTQNSFLKSLV